MVTKLEGRLTILAIVTYSISFWLLVTVIINLFLDCPRFRPTAAFRSGAPFVPFKYHFVATLVLVSHENKTPALRICDTSILNPFWSVTAVQCLYIFEKAEMYHVRIRSGSHDWEDGQEHLIEKYLTPAQRPLNETNYYIALIRVTDPFVGPKVSYVTIPHFDYSCEVYSSAAVISWSIQNNEAALDTTKLKMLHVMLLQETYCEKRYKSELIPTKTILCAGSYGGWNKLCSYDYGALLVQNRMLVGVAVRGPLCEFKELPGVFVKMSYFQKSIQLVLDEEEAFNKTEFPVTVL